MEQFRNQSEIIEQLSNIEISGGLAEDEVIDFYKMMKSTIDVLSFKTIEKSCYLVMEHPLTDAYIFQKGGSKEFETLKEYQKFLENVKVASERVKRNLKSYNQSEKILGEDLSKFAKMRDVFSDYVTQLIYFVNASIHMQECAKTKTNSVYLKEVLKTLPSMGVSLTKAGESVSGWERLGTGYDKLFKDSLDFFLVNSKLICDCAASVQETERKKQEEEEAKKPKIEYKQGNKVQPVENPVENERKMWIKKANDLYDELCLDFMRDLEKQYSASTKDMYETFVNVKFKKFVERFSMPLDGSISVGQAKEAYSQIMNLMDYISKISENAYTISVYSEKQ